VKRAVINGILVLPDGLRPGGVLLDGGRIEALLEPGAHPADCLIADAGGGYVTPGFIDLHVHGGGGADFTDGGADSFAAAGRMHLRHGTTAMTPTTLACAPERLEASLRAYEQALGLTGLPEFLGVHMEGPYFSHEMKGAQDPRYLKNPAPAEYLSLLDRYPSIRRWSLAPELPGALEMGDALRRRGVVASIAHTSATLEEVAAAIGHGFSSISHFYSCTSTIRREGGYRIPGATEAGLLFDELTLELIADGHHLPDSLIRLVYKVKGASRICLVTDAMRAAGLGDGPSYLGGISQNFPVIVEGGVAKLPDRSAFAGSVATADVLLRTALRAGLPLNDAVRALTLTPAELMGVSGRLGSLAPGKDADLVVLSREIGIQAVYAKGSPLEG
jgi:N-acetylglucosamine-6-phosphate deacetylase